MAVRSRPTELSEFLCFDLYAASRAVTSQYRPLLAPLKLTYPQYLALVVLWRERTCTVKQLSAALRLDYGTLTPLLQRLEAGGLVTRERRRDDERSVTVGLTEAGLAMERRARHIPAVIRDAIGLDDEQAAALQVILQSLTAAVTAYDAGK
ncbi:MAG: MarR family winged helix-turn-helix transcriptional regulator [Pseudonocardiales bacterium]